MPSDPTSKDTGPTPEATPGLNAASGLEADARPWWKRPRTLAVGALAVLLAAAPFVPRDDDAGAGQIATAAQSAQPALAATAGPGKVTSQMRTEIDAVVAEGQQARVTGRSLPGQLASSLVRCALFEGQRYCLGQGWTTATESEVQARVTTAARLAARPDNTRETTGDLDALAQLRRAARQTPAQRARHERAELAQAARSVAKVWLLRHELQGVDLPKGFLARHPEARADAAGTARAGTSQRTAYPRSRKILKRGHVSAQNRTYWCGPGAMQMIQWGWWGKPPTQRKMARVLRTTTSGTAISEMVRVVNRRSGWDRPTYAGRYVALDISDWKFGQWWRLIQRHVADYRAPVVMHPVLLKKYYPYLDDDASGHFQVGRGYLKTKKGLRFVSYFEPWNQQRFDRSEPYIERVQWRLAFRQYRANQAHFQHNIGV